MPEGGWEKWLADVTANETGDQRDYAVCAGNSGGGEPVDLFCMGGTALAKSDPVSAFQYTLKAAEKGYVPAEAALGMMYANGKGVQQNYAEAGKWWIKASEGGDLLAARHAWNLYRNGEGVDRDPNIANPLAKLIGEPVPVPRAPR